MYDGGDGRNCRRRFFDLKVQSGRAERAAPRKNSNNY